MIPVFAWFGKVYTLPNQAKARWSQFIGRATNSVDTAVRQDLRHGAFLVYPATARHRPIQDEPDFT